MKSKVNIIDYPIIVVGGGLSGAVVAERYASQRNRKVLVIERRSHIGGNCFDYKNKHGHLVPKYGPHFFHTNIQRVWEYVQKFSAWVPYKHRVLSYVDGKLVPIPVNITTVNKLLSLDIKNEIEFKAWLKNNTPKIKNPKNSEDIAISRVGKYLYEKLFKYYTKKQWDYWPHELEKSVLERIPVRTNFNEGYFSDRYQAIPKGGYTKLITRILDSPNIKVALNTDFFEIREKIKHFEKIFFTGRIDEYFECAGNEMLKYRSLKFEHVSINKKSYQEVAQVNYPEIKYKYTRVTEPKHATQQLSSCTTIIKEYPTWDGPACYPVPNEQETRKYLTLKKRADALTVKNIFFLGRLATYNYINMDIAINESLNLFDSLEKDGKTN